MRETKGFDSSLATPSFVCVSDAVLRRKQEGNGIARFVVNNREFGFDPAPSRLKVLYVEMSDRARRYRTFYNEYDFF